MTTLFIHIRTYIAMHKHMYAATYTHRVGVFTFKNKAHN